MNSEAPPTHVLQGLEDRLLVPLRELLLLLKFRPSQQFLDYLLARVVREMYRGSDGQNWGLTQQAVGDAIGLSRGRVQQILAQNLRPPGAEDALPELKLLLLTQLSAATTPLPHEALFARVRAVYGLAGDPSLARRVLGELNQLVQAGTVLIECTDAGTAYCLDPRYLSGPLPEPPDDVAVATFRTEIDRHLTFHEEMSGRTGVGPRIRWRYTADITPSLARDMDRRIRDAIARILADTEARATPLIARGEPELPIALFLVGSHVATQPLPGESS